MPVSGWMRDPLKLMVKANSGFAIDLYGRLRQAPGNLFFSPFSLSVALAMTYAGARGETQRQMARVLHLAGIGEDDVHVAQSRLAGELLQAGSGDVCLRLANALYPQAGYPFLPEFLARIEAHYGASITPLDYVHHSSAARQEINAWVARQTEDRIQDLVGAGVLNALTRLVLVNAIYFKGAWEEPFRPESTQEGPFWVSPGVSTPAAFMTQKREVWYLERDGIQAVGLPFAGNALGFFVILPADSQSLEVLETALTFKQLDGWLQRMNSRKVLVQLPKFRLEAAFRLNQVLAALGMPDAFDDERANFSGMDGRFPWLLISDVLHKAFFEVNEAGAEAAAASAVVIMQRAAPMPVPTFRADHPFLFLIRDQNSGSILFLGRLHDPSGV